MAGEAAVQHHHLADHGDPDRRRARQHRGRRAEMETEHEHAGGDADDQRLADDELRHQSQPHPVMGARDAVLGIGHHESWQCHAADVERNDLAGFDPRRQQFDEPRQQRRDHGRDTTNVIQRLPARKPRSSACSPRVRYSGMIFWAEDGNAEIHHAAEQQHPGPDIDIDAVVGAAHPAREQNLREIGKRCAEYANDEDRARQTLGHRGFAGAALPASRAAARAEPAGGVVAD